MGDDKQTVLIVVGNPMTETSLTSHFERRGWQATVCDDGDRAVDEYVASKPDLVLLSLDISGLDGHIAALEIRETHFNARIAFVSTRSGKALAEDAAYSAGATAVLTTPITSSDMDEVWEAMMGEIPGAPGLADLDELYPEMEPVMPTPLPLLPQSPPGMTPMPPLHPLPPLIEEKPAIAPKKKRRWIRKILLLIILGAISVGVAHYVGMVDISVYLEQLEDMLP
tara:strand:+ start:9729 stop:10403 length:675 start_codon:yes stop_codon:yes gene_type:complete